MSGGGCRGRTNPNHWPVAGRRYLLADLLREAARTARSRAADRRRRGALRIGARHHRPIPPGAAGQVQRGHRPPDALVQRQSGMDQEGDPAQRPLRLQQPVVAPVDGKADHVLRHDAARPARAGHLADPAQGVRAVRRSRADAARLRPLLRPRRDRPAARLSVVHEALHRRRLGRRQPDRQRAAAARRLRAERQIHHAPAEGHFSLRALRALPRPRAADPHRELRSARNRCTIATGSITISSARRTSRSSRT